MTYDEYTATEEDILYALKCGDLTEDQFYREMDALQEQWQEEGEE